jgi:hypothetical protein
MVWDNPTWGQERITNELLLKLGRRVSPRTVHKYMPKYLKEGITTIGWKRRRRDDDDTMTDTSTVYDTPTHHS